MGGSSSENRNPPSRGTGLPPGQSHQTDTINLLNRAQTGDDRALDELCSRYLPRLYRWAAGRLSQSTRRVVETGDLVQEVLLGTIRNLEDLHPRYPGSFPAYLRRALLNRINDETRKAGRRPPLAALDGNEPDCSPSPLERSIGQDLQQQYETAMMRLKEEERAAVFLRVELKIDYAEIASVLSKPSSDAARMTVQRALVRLAEEISDEI